MKRFFFLLVLTPLNIFAQISGSFTNGASINFKDLSYSNVIGLHETSDGFVALFESSDYALGTYIYKSTIVKFDNDGNLIDDFAESGFLKVEIEGFENTRSRDLVVGANGEVYVLAQLVTNPSNNIQRAAVIKYTNVGELDSTFGSDGYQILHTNIAYTHIGNDLKVDKKNGVYVVGSVYDPREFYDPFPFVVKLNSNGTEDLTFNGIGYIVFKTLSEQDVSNARVMHIAGGSAKTIDLLEDGSLLISGDISNQLEKLVFLAKLTASGTFDNDFYGNGYYFPSLDGFEFLEFTTSVPWGGRVVYSLKQSGMPYNLSYGIFDEVGLTAFVEDINQNQDIITDLFTGNGTLYSLSKMIFTSRFNELAIPDESYITSLRDTIGTEFFKKHHKIQFSLFNKLELEKGIYLNEDQSIVVAGKYYNGNTYSSFLSKIDAVNVGVQNEEIVNFLIYPTVVKNSLIIESDRVIQNYILLDFQGKEIKIELKKGLNDLSSLSEGWYYLKIPNSDAKPFFKMP